MTYEDYKREKKRLEDELVRLDWVFEKEASVHVGDAIIYKGKEYIVRETKISSEWKDVVVRRVSKKNKDGHWSSRVLSLRFDEAVVKDTNVKVIVDDWGA